jgi:hypothetical protein
MSTARHAFATVMRTHHFQRVLVVGGEQRCAASDGNLPTVGTGPESVRTDDAEVLALPSDGAQDACEHLLDAAEGVDRLQ